jgi:hypothetical protein
MRNPGNELSKGRIFSDSTIAPGLLATVERVFQLKFLIGNLLIPRDKLLCSAFDLIEQAPALTFNIADAQGMEPADHANKTENEYALKPGGLPKGRNNRQTNCDAGFIPNSVIIRAFDS